jgi:hypothetical protein
VARILDDASVDQGQALAPYRGSRSALACNQAEECDQSIAIVRHSPHNRVLILLRRPVHHIVTQQIVALGQLLGASHIDQPGFLPVLHPPLDRVHVGPVLLVLGTEIYAVVAGLKADKAFDQRQPAGSKSSGSRKADA